MIALAMFMLVWKVFLCDNKRVEHTSERGDKMFEVHIPEITDGELMSRCELMKPIIKNDDGTFSWIEGAANLSIDVLRNTPFVSCDIDTKSFYKSSSLSLTEGIGLKKGDLVKQGEILGMGHFACIHKFAEYNRFEPTIADILAQITDEMFERFRVQAFQIVKLPRGGLNEQLEAEFYRNGYQVSVVRLYRKENVH